MLLKIASCFLKIEWLSFQRFGSSPYQRISDPSCARTWCRLFSLDEWLNYELSHHLWTSNLLNHIRSHYIKHSTNQHFHNYSPMSLQVVIAISWFGFTCFCLGFAAVRILLFDWNCSDGWHFGFYYLRPGLIRGASNYSLSLQSDWGTDTIHTETLPEYLIIIMSVIGSGSSLALKFSWL